MRKYFFILLPVLCIYACTKDVEMPDSLPASSETVNGFIVQWSDFMDEERRQVVREILNDMIPVKGGFFAMGASSTDDSDARPNEAPVHWVELTDFYVCAHEISYDQVQRLMGTTRASNIYDFNGKYLRYSWEDWQNILDLLKDLSGIQFSFPTEVQWEYAARGGNVSKGFIYPGAKKLLDVWSESLDESNNSVPNELGLYNMADKNSEWCLDYYNDYSSGSIKKNPCVTYDYGYGHVVRGGCHASSGTYKNWEKASVSTSYYSFINVYVDRRMCRSTTRAYHRGASWDIGCRPVINIKK